MSIKLDLKQFTHIKSDKNSTTLKHKDGHELTIAHKALSPEGKSQLEQLAKLSATPDQHNESKTDNLAKGGKVKEYADGSDDVQADDSAPEVPAALSPNAPAEDQSEPELASADAPQQDDSLKVKRDIYNKLINKNPGAPELSAQSDEMFGPNGEPPKNFNSKEFEVASKQYDQEQQLKQQQTAMAANSAVKDNAIRQSAGLDPIPVPTVQAEPNGQIPQVQPQAAVQPQQTQAPTGGGSLTSNPEGMLASGFNQQLQGIQAGAKAEGELGQAQAQQLDTGIQAQQQAQTAFKNSFGQLEQERQAAIKDIKDGYINPEHYWTGDPKTGEGGHSKIAAGIGMILAGFNPTNNPNAAIGFLNSQMDRNMAAQARNLGAKESLLAHNMQQFGNLRDATDMTRVMQNDMLTHQLEEAGAKAKTPMAAAAAQQAAGQLKMQSASLFQQFAMRRAMMNLAGGDNQNPAAVEHMIGYMRAVNPAMAKDMESRYVPGVGLASVPVPESVRSQIVATKSVNDLMNDSLNFSRQHTGTLSPQLMAQAKTIQQQLIGSIKQAQHDGVYKPSEAGFILDQIGGSPASFLSSLSSVPKIKQMQQIKQQEYSNLLRTNGLPDKQLEQQPVFATKGGVKYQKVNGGWQKVK